MTLFVVDAKVGVHPSDSKVADMLRATGKPWLLVANKVEILSTGGTATHLRNAGIPVTSIAEWSGAPEILGGRLVTVNQGPAWPGVEALRLHLHSNDTIIVQ